MESDKPLVECSWCGGECWEGEFRNRRGEVFCTKWHRRQSNEALKDLQSDSMWMAKRTLTGEWTK